MFLVYEKNYLSYGDVDCVEETDMKLYDNKRKSNNRNGTEKDSVY